MPDHLPHHGFRELPAPSGGAHAAVARGRHLRRRRAALQLGAGLTTLGLVVAGALAVGGSQGLSAHDRLIPGHGTGLVASATPTATSPLSAPATVSTPPASANRATTPPPSRPSPSTTPAAGPARTLPYRTPNLRRTYASPKTLSASPSVSVCGANYSGGTDGAGQTRADWCVDERVTTSTHGRDLVLELCRDQSGAAPLTFRGAREVDIVVRRGEREVWRWSVDHPDTGPGHTLDTPSTACWTWTAPWTTVDQHGRPLPRGDYTMLATTQASGVATFPSDAVAFSV